MKLTKQSFSDALKGFMLVLSVLFILINLISLFDHGVEEWLKKFDCHKLGEY